MTMYIGSARMSETGGINGKVGDQKQKLTDSVDKVGEVAVEKFYNHSKGWDILRAKEIEIANKIADLMLEACNNENIGYGQSGDANRYGIIKNGIKTKVKTNCDCSSLAREVVKEASGVDAGDFTTSNEKTKLLATGLFDYVGKYSSKTVLYDGDILVTCTKGHTAIVVSGNRRKKASQSTAKKYYPKCSADHVSIVNALLEVGEKDFSITHRKKIAVANGFVKSEKEWTGTASQNKKMLEALKKGSLIKA